MSAPLVLHPEIQQITDENALLREELASLLTEAEDLIHTVKPNLLALYQTKIGVWELRLLQAQFTVARVRRQIELAQASINRGERPDLIAIECALEVEFLEWVTKLEEAAQRIQDGGKPLETSAVAGGRPRVEEIVLRAGEAVAPRRESKRDRGPAAALVAGAVGL